MFIALDKLHNQGIRKAIIAVPERSIGGSFANEPLTKFGFHWDWTVKPQWNLCNTPGIDDPRVAKSKVKAVGEFLASEDQILIATHATFRFAVEELGIEAFDDCLIAVDEFHHVSASPDNKLCAQLGALIARDKVHIVAMTGSYFRGGRRAGAVAGRRGEIRHSDLHLLRAAQRLRAHEVARARLLLLFRQLPRCHQGRARSRTEDHRPHPKRQCAG